MTLHQQQTVVSTARTTADAERRRLARELHDGVGYHLLVLGLHARRLAASHPDLRKQAEVIDNLARAAMYEMRGVVSRLHRPPGCPVGGVAHRADRPAPSWVDVVDTVAAAGVAGSSIGLNDVAAFDDMAPPVRHAVLRLVQESTANAIKHGSGEVEVQVRMGREVTVCVSSAPREPGQGEDGGGTGLREMSQRLAELGGALERSGAGLGGRFTVRATLPLSNAS